MGRLWLWLLMGLGAMPGSPQEFVDWQAVSGIRLEATKNSQVMETARMLTDVLGPRLTNSPNMPRAEAWAKETMARWGLANVRLEGFEFGRGWTFARCAVEMVKPTHAVLSAYPKGWSPGTEGRRVGEAVRVTLATEQDLEQQKGKLGGKILLLHPPAEIKPPEEPLFKRLSEEDLEQIKQFSLRPPRDDQWRQQARREWTFGRRLAQFLAAEGVVATVEVSSRDGGAVRVTGTPAWRTDFPAGVPALVMAAEAYNRFARLLEQGERVELAVEVEAQFVEGDPRA
ncbi:MAG: hypothetical protein NZ869_06780 [Thermoanaerobaculum sp.]|nr:hypothetical protein [Thermoanaerobaculum sp.]MDW7966532.1 hypothetical protein [Thermoanaerobaculum sp.]